MCTHLEVCMDIGQSKETNGMSNVSFSCKAFLVFLLPCDWLTKYVSSWDECIGWDEGIDYESTLAKSKTSDKLVKLSWSSNLNSQRPRYE